MSKELRGAVPFDEGMADMYRKNPEMAAGMRNFFPPRETLPGSPPGFFLSF